MVSTMLKHCLLIFIIRFVIGADVTMAPESMIAPLYAPVSFQCIGTGDILTWLIESNPVTDLVQHERNVTINDNSNGNNLASVLTIIALPINDGIEIGCILASLNPYQPVFIEVMLTIRGVSSIENLALNFTLDNYLLISWSPPAYRSNDISATSLEYEVLINSDDTLILNTTVSNISIELANITECNAYSVSVTATGAQYTSKINTVVKVNGIQNCFIGDEKMSYLLGKVKCMIQVICLPLLCNGTIINIEASSDVNSDTYIDQFDVSELKGPNKEINNITLHLNQLVEFRHYNISVKVLDTMGNIINTQEYIAISTYLTQGLSISSTSDQNINGSVLVKCIFIQGLPAKQCYVVFTDINQGLEESFHVTGSEDSLLTLSFSGNYSVTAYDIFNGSIFGPAVKHPFILAISVPSSASTSTSAGRMFSELDLLTLTSISSVKISSISQYSFMITDIPDVVKPSQASSSKTVILLSIGGTILVIVTLLLLITLSSIILIKRKAKNEIANITENPAYDYAPRADCDHVTGVDTEVNPAYSTLKGTVQVYETVW